MPTHIESFEVGKMLQSFIKSSHCYDARDMRRFFLDDEIGMIPPWLVALGDEYDRQVNWAGTKDHGVFIAHKVIREFLSRAQG